MNYEDIWQIQDEITAAVNSLDFSLWDLHYDRDSFSFHMELNEHLPDEVFIFLTKFCRHSVHRCPCQQIMMGRGIMGRYSYCDNKE